MAVINPIQNSFSAGELSPLMFGRSDVAGYNMGLAEMLNMLPDSRGPAISRRGGRYVRSFTGNEGRIIPIPVTKDKFYTGIFLDETLTIGSVLTGGTGVADSVNPAFKDGLTGWTDVTDGNNTSTVILTGQTVELSIEKANNRFAYITQEFALPVGTERTIKWIVGGTGAGRIRVGSTALGSDLLDIETTNTSGVVDFDSNGFTTLFLTVIISNDLADEAALLEVSYLGVSETNAQELFSSVTPYSENHVQDLQYVQAPSGDDIYILHELYPPYKITYDNISNTFTYAIVAFTGQPPQWVANSYPSTGAFFQGRLWLGGAPITPQTFWGSVSGSNEDFTIGAIADDALEFTMAQYGKIEWMAGFKNLLIGTDNGEHIVKSDGGVITPSDIQVDQQSSYGSANVQPVQVGDQIFYVSPDRLKLRAIQYEWQADNWLSKDLTFNSEHITASGIKRIVWHQNPKNLLHCVLMNGDVATMTYDRSTNSLGWAQRVGQAFIVDGAVAPINGTDLLHGISRLRPNELQLTTQAQFPDYGLVDAWVEKLTTGADNTLVEGLAHLEGFTVQVLLDGAVHPDRVVTGGQITLAYTGTLAKVGLGYTRRIKTLPLDMGSKTGSGASYTKRWKKIFVRILSSANPIINGVRPSSRSPSTPMNEKEPDKTGDVEVLGMDHSLQAPIIIEETLPVDLRVISLFGEMNQNE